MSLCVIGAKTLVLAATAFTLTWRHTVEKTLWTEEWRVERTGLRLLRAKIESTGAGMEMPESSTFDGHFWSWTPNLPLQAELRLRRSDAAPEGWRLCAAGKCRAIADRAETADVVTVRACREGS